ncbi:MAG: hypothetical protein AABW83_02575 [Nanoarchaeota archaeon]
MNLDEISDDFILMKKSEVSKLPLFKSFRQFDLSDLIGEMIVQTREIKNPKEYNPEVESPNPEYFKVLIFKSDNFLIFEEEGWQDGTTLHSYFYDGKSVRYNNDLFRD